MSDIKVRRSQIFWLIIYIIAMITIGFISFEALGIIWGFGSLLAVGVMFDEKTDDQDMAYANNLGVNDIWWYFNGYNLVL